MQIRDMEATLGVAVFERGTRKVRLTGVGERIATSARAILRAVDELGDLARSSKDGLGGRLRIGVIPTVAPYLLPTLARELMRSHPGVTATFCEALARVGVNIDLMSTSEIRISVLVKDTELDKAVGALHEAFNLGGDEAAVVYGGTGR